MNSVVCSITTKKCFLNSAKPQSAPIQNKRVTSGTKGRFKQSVVPNKVKPVHYTLSKLRLLPTSKENANRMRNYGEMFKMCHSAQLNILRARPPSKKPPSNSRRNKCHNH